MILLRMFSKKEQKKEEKSREEKIGRDIGTAIGMGYGGIKTYEINKSIGKYSKRIQDNPEKVRKYIRKIYKPISEEIGEELAKNKTIVEGLSKNATKLGKTAKAGTIGLGILSVLKMRDLGGKIGKKVSDKRKSKNK